MYRHRFTTQEEIKKKRLYRNHVLQLFIKIKLRYYNFYILIFDAPRSWKIFTTNTCHLCIVQVFSFLSVIKCNHFYNRVSNRLAGLNSKIIAFYFFFSLWKGVLSREYSGKKGGGEKLSYNPTRDNKSRHFFRPFSYFDAKPAIRVDCMVFWGLFFDLYAVYPSN